jgi:sigma-E factor negative regulatory protein RseA
MASLGGAVATAPSIVTADTSAGPMMRDARLDELMAAHRQVGGNSALQVPAGFLRNATYEGAAR